MRKTEHSGGQTHERIMNLPKDVWERMLKRKPEAGVTWELAPISQPDTKVVEIPITKVSTIPAKKEVEAGINDKAAPCMDKFTAMSTADLKALAKGKIKSSHLMGRDMLIAKLSENGQSLPH